MSDRDPGDEDVLRRSMTELIYAKHYSRCDLCAEFIPRHLEVEAPLMDHGDQFEKCVCCVGCRALAARMFAVSRKRQDSARRLVLFRELGQPTEGR